MYIKYVNNVLGSQSVCLQWTVHIRRAQGMAFALQGVRACARKGGEVLTAPNRTMKHFSVFRTAPPMASSIWSRRLVPVSPGGLEKIARKV